MWVKISTEDIGTYLHVSQKEYLEGKGIPSPLLALTKDVIAWLRAEIRSGGQTVSVRKEMIPECLRSAACWLVIEGLHARFPSMRMTPEQKALSQVARDLVARVANGKLHIESPPDPMDPEEQVSEKGFEDVSKRFRDATAKRLRGL